MKVNFSADPWAPSLWGGFMLNLRTELPLVAELSYNQRFSRVQSEHSGLKKARLIKKKQNKQITNLVFLIAPPEV